jgi:D-3-phosphoglycerate dehydrogenase
MLALFKNLVAEVEITRGGKWKRLIGHEIMGKRIGIVGLGRIGKEVAIRANAFGMEITRGGKWKRLIGHEIMGKRIGIIGLGRIGKEVAIRANAFGMEIVGHDIYWPDAFADEYAITKAQSLEEIFESCDIISLHTNLTGETRDMINLQSLSRMKDGVIIINCARGELVSTSAMVHALKIGKVGGYGTDVLDEEPPAADHPLLKEPNCIVTPHIGSRTYESVVRQATASVKNLILVMNGEKPLAQVNKLGEGQWAK